MPKSTEPIGIDFQSLGTNEIDWAAEVESNALSAALLFGLIQFASVLMVNWRESTVPLFGGGASVASLALISSIILSLIVSPVAFSRGVRHRNANLPAELARSDRLGMIPLTIGVTLLVALLVVAVFEIVALSFEGVMLGQAPTAMILVLIAGGLAYIITRHLMLASTAGLLVNLAVTYLFATLLFSTVFNDNPLWWQKSFSYLGMSKSNSRYIFDIGLVFSGILVVIWQVYFMQGFVALEKMGTINGRTVTIMRWALVLTGICLASVGIFRYGMSPFFNVVHDTSATGVGVMLGLLMLGLRWLIPGYQPRFYDISIAIALTLLVSVVLKVAGFFNLVGLELGAFALAGLWLILFYRSTELLVAKSIVQASGDQGTAIE